MQDDQPGYIKDNFDYSYYMSNAFSSHNMSTTGRLYNNLIKAIKAIKEEVVFPKLIVFIPDDDIIEYLTDREDYCGNFDIVLDKMFNNIRKAIQAYKEFLPKKGRKPEYPHILWIEPPLHCHFTPTGNHRRQLFNESLRTSASKQAGVSVLHLKKIWDPDNRLLFLAEQERFTADGIMTYWSAVKNTIRYCITVIDRNKAKAIKGIRKFYPAQRNTDKQSMSKFIDNRRHARSR